MVGLAGIGGAEHRANVWGSLLEPRGGGAVRAFWHRWHGADEVLGFTLAAHWASLLAALGVALLVRAPGGVHSMLARPVVTLHDDDAPAVPLLSRVQLRQRTWLARWLHGAATRVGDAMCACVVVALYTVVAFRGLWLVLDEYTWTRPNRAFTHCGWTCSGGGVGLAVVLSVLRP